MTKKAIYAGTDSLGATPADFPETRWYGNWIWLPAEGGGPAGAFGQQSTERPEAHGLFRKTFELDSVPDRVPARISADSRYLLWANGKEVFRGPVRSQPRRLHYDLFDLAPYLRSGSNCLAVYVKYYGKPKSYWMPATPNSMLGAHGVMVFEADLGEAGWLGSDASWKALAGASWSELATEGPAITRGVPVEIFDARKHAYGWTETDFDDSGWVHAQPVPAVHIGGFARTHPPTDPYGPMYPRSIAKLGGEEKIPAAIEAKLLEGAVQAETNDPVAIVAASVDLAASDDLPSGSLPLSFELPEGRAARLHVDMGGIVSGFVRLGIRAPAGTVFDIRYTEEPEFTQTAMVAMHTGTRFVASGGDDRFEVFDSNGFRYAHVLVHGAHGSVSLEGFSVREHIYPWREGAGFACSDEELNRIYTAGIRTVQLNSHDAFLDCPTREQRAWVGDSVVHQMVHLATNLDWRLARHNVILGNSPRSDGILPMSVVGEMESGGGLTIPDWSLHWIHALHNLYRFTGERELVKELLPTAERILRWYAQYQGTNGLLKDVPEWNLIDWSSVHTEDTSAAINASWARGLLELTEMAAWLGETATREWARDRYERVKAGFEAFWDEARGSYVDHIVDGTQRRPMSQIPGAMAICAGIAPAERAKRIIETITNPESLVIRTWAGFDREDSQERMIKQFRGIYEADWDVEKEIVSAEPFMSYVVHDAIAAAGLADTLPGLYRRWLRFLRDGYDTIGECWNWGTHVHGWSCTPVKDLVFYTLGVTPAEPGYTKARIAPRLGPLEWAEGTVPTPQGLINVRATKDSVAVNSPVPVILDAAGREPRELPAGSHTI